MDSQLFARALGTVGPETVQRAEPSRRLHAIQPAPDIEFDGRGPQPTTYDGDQQSKSRGAIGEEIRAHRAGVNCIAIDRFEGRQ